jgi:hypothetical protein
MELTTIQRDESVETCEAIIFIDLGIECAIDGNKLEQIMLSAGHVYVSHARIHFK